MLRLAPALAALFVVCFASSASAQPSGPPGGAPPPPPANGIERSGFLIGFSLGGGSFGLDDCRGCETVDGVAFDLHIGGMLTPRLGLMWDGYAVGDGDDTGTVTHSLHTVAAQYWIAPRVWLKGGLGFGRLTFSDGDGDIVAESETGAGFLVAAGVELVQTRRFALDLQLRGSGVAYDENESISMGSLGLGFNWY